MKNDEQKDKLQEEKTNVQKARSFQQVIHLAQQNYKEILENIEPIIAYGNMSVEEIECFVQHYESPYIEQWQGSATEEQRLQIETLHKEMDLCLQVLFVRYHLIVKQLFIEQLALYGYEVQGNVFAHFMEAKQATSFSYINESLIYQQFVVDERDHICLVKKHPVYRIKVTSSLQCRIYQYPHLFYPYQDYDINDVDVLMENGRIVLHSFSLKETTSEKVVSFKRGSLRKDKGLIYCFEPYSYTDIDDVSAIVYKTMEIYKLRV